MAVYFKPQDPYASTSASLGSATGKGLAQMLQNLTQQHLANTAQRKQTFQTAQGLASLGVPPNTALQIASMPLPLQQTFMKHFMGSEAAGFQEQQPQVAEQQVSPQEYVNQQTQIAAEQQIPEQQPLNAQEEMPQAEIKKDLFTPDHVDTVKKMYEQALKKKGVKISPEEHEVVKNFIEKPSEDSYNKIKDLYEQSTKKQKPEVITEKIPSEEPVKTERQKTFNQLLATPKLKPLEKERMETLKAQRQKIQGTEQKEIDKDTKDFYEDTSKKYKMSKETNMSLDRMKELNKKATLASPGHAAILDFLSDGLPWGIHLNLKGMFYSPDSQEFEKLSKGMLSKVKDMFGARITQYEVAQFLQTIPTLSMSKSGRNRVINNMKTLNEAAALRYNTMQEIIDRNGGKRPRNLDSLVEKMASSKLDQLAEKFSKGQKNPPKPLFHKFRKTFGLESKKTEE